MTLTHLLPEAATRELVFSGGRLSTLPRAFSGVPVMSQPAPAPASHLPGDRVHVVWEPPTRVPHDGHPVYGGNDRRHAGRTVRRSGVPTPMDGEVEWSQRVQTYFLLAAGRGVRRVAFDVTVRGRNVTIWRTTFPVFSKCFFIGEDYYYLFFLN